MTYSSSNRASQHVFRRLTETEAGPRLEPEEYAVFRERRQRVKRWLEELGVTDLHTVHPNYDGGGDLYGRDLQFLEDPTVAGSLPNQTGSYRTKTGTWGPIFADAGIVRHASGHQLIVVVFLEGQPAYRGSFIEKLTRRAVRRLLPEPGAAEKAAAGGG
jgi:hypothetical protein